MPTSVLGSFGLLITKGRDKRDESSCRKIQQHPDSLASGECVWAPSCRHCLLSHARLVFLLNFERLTFERRDGVGGGWYRYHYSFSYMFSIHDSLLPAVLKFSQIFLNYCILQFANFPADLPPGSLSYPAQRRGATRQPVTHSLRDGLCGERREKYPGCPGAQISSVRKRQVQAERWLDWEIVMLALPTLLC